MPEPSIAVAPADAAPLEVHAPYSLAVRLLFEVWYVWVGFEALLDRGSEAEPEADVRPEDTWILLYTSGTTGKPKGVLRSHESYVAFYLINAIDFDFRPGERVLNIMPLCHVNTTFFTFNFTYIGATTYVHPARRFDPAEQLGLINRACEWPCPAPGSMPTACCAPPSAVTTRCCFSSTSTCTGRPTTRDDIQARTT